MTGPSGRSIATSAQPSLANRRTTAVRPTAVVRRLAKLGCAEVAIERPDGPVVDELLEAGLTVVVISPNQVKNLRSRYGSAGNKDDRFEAYVLADTLRSVARQARSSGRTLTQGYSQRVGGLSPSVAHRNRRPSSRSSSSSCVVTARSVPSSAGIQRFSTARSRALVTASSALSSTTARSAAACATAAISALRCAAAANISAGPPTGGSAPCRNEHSARTGRRTPTVTSQTTSTSAGGLAPCSSPR